MRDVIRPSVPSKGYDVSYVRNRVIVCAVQGLLRNATPDVARPFVCSPRAIMPCHTGRRPTVYDIEGP